MNDTVYPSGVTNGLTRRVLVASALRLSYFTIAWNGIIGATALIVSTVTDSLALAGFALNALLRPSPTPRGLSG